MGAGEAVLTVVGAVLFVASAGLALLADYYKQHRERKAEAGELSIEAGLPQVRHDRHRSEDEEPRRCCCSCCCCEAASSEYDGRVKVRYLSFAIDYSGKAYWSFVAGCVVFVPTFILTAKWQTEAAEARALGEEHVGNLMIYAIMGAVCGVLMSAVPTRTTAGVVVHGLTASAFQAVGIAYGVEAVQLADALFESDALFITRAAILTCSVGAAVGSLAILPKAMSEGRIMDPNTENEKEPSPRHIKHARRWMAALAGCQIALGTSIGLMVATGAAEAALI